MRYIFLLFIFSSFPAFAGEICEGYPKDKEALYSWSENDFTKAKADEALSQIQAAMKTNGSMGNCELPNSMIIIEGYILKEQALQALSIEGLDKGLVQYHISGFCEFVRNNSICE